MTYREALCKAIVSEKGMAFPYFVLSVSILHAKVSKLSMDRYLEEHSADTLIRLMTGDGNTILPLGSAIDIAIWGFLEWLMAEPAKDMPDGIMWYEGPAVSLKYEEYATMRGKGNHGSK